VKSWAKAGTDCAVGHMGLGALSAYLPSAFSMALSLGFSAYEALRAKPDSEKLKGIGEFGAGYLIAKVLKGC
jgi:hypothetical protein